ncbi:alcohol dehydrogenase [Breoghania corrubedonensis]|uniref:Alcohol dehydrogenase n=1 Tax=Breoghania corrubedonensis TaxID=665038 RepID=A0A2T5VH94_9HYPH|nr:zinc-binding dehydrogenase [Breoghania corrubedonensis]PTW63120.1 alcohol dehydrogenase [Breoghania corrubedonensis]
MPKTMRAWQLDRLGGKLELVERPIPEPRAGSALIEIEAVILPSYLQDYVEGKLPTYIAPDRPFTPGSNAVGRVAAVGRDVWHLKPGQRVVLSSHFTAGENVADPAQALLGITSFGGSSTAMQADWPDGTLAEYALWPVSAVTVAEELDFVQADILASAARFAVPYGGLRRGRLAAGETVVISGATGAYGSAAVLVALAMGAGRVVAAGRNASALAALADVAGPRLRTVVLSGDVKADASALRDAAGGPVALAFDMVGQAGSASATLAALGCLSRNGRLVLMGSMTVPLPINYLEVMGMGLEIIGNFMYPRTALADIFALARAGLLDLSVIRPRSFPLEALAEAMAAARIAGNMRCVVVRGRPG